ncbi:DNA-binding response regulator [Flavobacterium cupreum]|uniref:DNA-binding response regulator n=1 Tax=Flavobacterium cupreum TaxID=2133766 RepID=A0A434A202_9FLAO|nr:response regulator [Flavobacterium cupreum]RUT68367.1 DNA-binding response regulator [Flavobacterium cupreum]
MDYNILIVDDHPMTVDSYVSLLSDSNLHKNNVNFIKSYNCEDAYKKIKILFAEGKNIDFALLDINLPPYPDLKINSGKDLAFCIRKMHPNCKITLLTMHTESSIIDSIIKKINPEGFISKSDINFEIFPTICNKIIQGEKFYSAEIIKSQRELLKQNINWDEHDSQILVLLSQGIKNINLPNYIPLSMSAIEKRKASIKNQLLSTKGNDSELIAKAKKIGLL